MWRPQLASPSADVRVIAPDRPGYGAAEAPAAFDVARRAFALRVLAA